MELSLTPEHEQAIRRYNELLERFSVLEAEKGQLVHHTLPMLHARYLQLVGDIKLELLNLQYACFALRRKLEMIRSALQRGSPVLLEVIETLVSAEMVEQRTRLLEEAKALQQAIEHGSLGILSDEDAIELKKTYHQLAKLLHPDLHPDADERMKAFWLQAVDAYSRGDLQKLQVLLILLENENFKVLPIQDTLYSELVRKNNYLQMVVDDLEKHNEQVKNTFPYTHIEMMENPDWVKEQRRMHEELIAAVRLESDHYSAVIAELLKDVSP